jgi:hypothetical protein
MSDNNEHIYDEEPEKHRQGGDDEQLLDFSADVQPTESLIKPSAPTATSDHHDNGYIVVPPTPQSSVDSTTSDREVHDVNDEVERQQEDINRVIEELTSKTAFQAQSVNSIVAEADSSTGNNTNISHIVDAASPAPSIAQSSASAEDNKAAQRKSNKSGCNTVGCTLCPYYLLGIYIIKKSFSVFVLSYKQNKCSDLFFYKWLCL